MNFSSKNVGKLFEDGTEFLEVLEGIIPLVETFIPRIMNLYGALKRSWAESKLPEVQATNAQAAVAAYVNAGFTTEEAMMLMTVGKSQLATIISILAGLQSSINLKKEIEQKDEMEEKQPIQGNVEETFAALDAVNEAFMNATNEDKFEPNQ